MKRIPPPHMRDFKHRFVTRRDFLAAGFLSFSAMTLLPRWVRADGAPMCGGVANPDQVAFMAFDMPGGGSMPGNFLVGKRGGPQDLLKSYDTLGWDPRVSGALNTDFGLPMSAKSSRMLAGILQSASAGARANLRMGSICHISQPDSSANQLNASILAGKAGTRGSYVGNGLGMVDSLSGGNSAAFSENITQKPVLVNSVNDILSSTNFGGAAFNGIAKEQMRAFAKGSIDLSKAQAQDYVNNPGGDVLANASVCAYSKTLDFVAGSEGLDPRTDTNAQGVYQINQQTAANDPNAVAAGLVMNSLYGYTGPSTWVHANCDYHSGSNEPGDTLDFQIGQQIGFAVELAFRMKKPLFFQIITDGGNEAVQGTRNWSADSPDKSLTVIGYFDPSAPPKLIRQQVGQYSEGQGADPNSLVGSNGAFACYASFANYLNILGRLGDFATILPGIFAGPKELDSVLIFEGKQPS